MDVAQILPRDSVKYWVNSLLEILKNPPSSLPKFVFTLKHFIFEDISVILKSRSKTWGVHTFSVAIELTIQLKLALKIALLQLHFWLCVTGLCIIHSLEVSTFTSRQEPSPWTSLGVVCTGSQVSIRHCYQHHNTLKLCWILWRKVSTLNNSGD